MADNSKNRVEEREISLADLAIDILLHWRRIIVAMLLGGLLFGGVSYLQIAGDKNALEVDIPRSDEQWLIGQLTDAEIKDVNMAVLYQQLYEDYLFYHHHSIAMQADPYNVPREELIFLIQSDDMERSRNIRKIYEDIATSSGLYEYLKATCNVDSGVTEMIVLENTSYGLVQGKGESLHVSVQHYNTEANDSFKVVVLHYDEETCKNIANAVLEYMNQQSEALLPDLGEHDLILLDRSFSIVFMAEFLERRREITNQLVEYSDTRTMLIKEFSDEQLYYYNYLIYGELPSDLSYDASVEDFGENVVSARNATQRISKRYVVLGSLIFAFAYVCILLIQYVLNKKLRLNDSFAELYEIPHLGIIPQKQRTKKRWFEFVDQFILSFCNPNVRRFTFEEALDLAGTSIKISAEQDGIKEVTLVGCNLKGQTMDVCESLEECLKKEGIHVEILNNAIYDAQAMKNLRNVESVVLVETAGVTFYDEVQKEVELLQRQKIRVLGAIMVS